MMLWLTRVYIGLVFTYITYIIGVAGLHTVCGCLR